MPAAETPPPRHTLGCVSYLNAKPLIHGVADDQTAVAYAVPSRLLTGLLDGRFDLALCPVIDACRHPDQLEIVPVGGIGCLGPTWTVRLFSRVPLEQLTAVHLDADSHTSVALLRVLLREQFGLHPEWIAHDFARPLPTDTQAALLIGDKVVTRPPPPGDFPHQLDLGQAWHELTGLPFVFAAWMTRRGSNLDPLPEKLADTLEHNLGHLEALVTRYAEPHGWPEDQARDYLGRVLRYRVGPDETRAIQHFAQLVAADSADTASSNTSDTNTSPGPVFRVPTPQSS